MRILVIEATVAVFGFALSFGYLPSLALADYPLPPRYEDDGSAIFVEDDYVRFLFRQMHGPAIYPSSEETQGSRRVEETTAELIEYRSQESEGTIVIETANHSLFLVLKNGQAIRYSVGVGRDGYAWHGVETITRKAEWPAWTPTAELHRDRPGLPDRVAGGPDNPLGARALYLGDTLYRIHGTNEPGTVGTNVSSGCIRMTNADITDLYQRVEIGTKVVVR